MKRFCLVLFVIAFMVSVMSSYAAAQASNYITLKPGIYSPQTSDLDHFNTGFNGEIAFGHQYNRNFAAEIGIGYFNSEGSHQEAGQVGGTSYALREKATIDVVPITLSLKGIIPFDKWDFFALGGIGAYIARGKVTVTGNVGGTPAGGSVSDTDTVFGAHAGVGFHYNITPNWFIGAEGKYIWTNEAKLRDNVGGVPVEADFKMDGILATAVLGFRF